MEQVSCNVCGATETTALYQLPDYLLQRMDVRAQLVQCRQCGLVYQNPRPTLAEMAAHYPLEYESYASEPAGGNLLSRQVVQYGIAKRVRFVTAHKTAGRLLDIGCASGIFLRGLRARGGWEVQGVEINAAVARLARQQYQLDVFAGTLEQAAFPDAHFDAVTMWDVLEHLHDPAASLHEVRRILKPDGLLVVRVPNLGSRDAKLFGPHWAGLDAPRHLFVFTAQTLNRLLLASDFRAQAWSCGIGAYTTFLLSVRFWAAAQRQHSPSRDALIQLLYHPVMRVVAAPAFNLRSLGLRGPSLVVVAMSGPR